MESQKGSWTRTRTRTRTTEPAGSTTTTRTAATTTPNVWLQFLSISNIESPIASGGLTNLMFNLVMVQDRLTTKPRYL